MVQASRDCSIDSSRSNSLLLCKIRRLQRSVTAVYRKMEPVKTSVPFFDLFIED